MQNIYIDNSKILIIILVAIWTIPWKAVALWKSARNNSKIWFIFLLIFNTVGILEILYIFIFSKRAKGDQELQQGN
jgi:hypothetical protein